MITSFPFVGNVHSVRVFSGYLYFAAKTDAGEKIWRAPISASGLGATELYFDFAAAYPTNVPLAITFASDGTMYVGTDSKDGLLIVTSNKTYSAPYAIYSALFGTGLNYFAWGSADDLYATTSNGSLLKFTISREDERSILRQQTVSVWAGFPPVSEALEEVSLHVSRLTER